MWRSVTPFLSYLLWFIISVSLSLYFWFFHFTPFSRHLYLYSCSLSVSLPLLHSLSFAPPLTDWRGKEFAYRRVRETAQSHNSSAIGEANNCGLLRREKSHITRRSDVIHKNRTMEHKIVKLMCNDFAFLCRFMIFIHIRKTFLLMLLWFQLHCSVQSRNSRTLD